MLWKEPVNGNEQLRGAEQATIPRFLKSIINSYIPGAGVKGTFSVHLKNVLFCDNVVFPD